MRFGSRLALAALALVALSAALSACSYRNPDINTVVDPYWRKSDFDPNTQWYFRTTVVDAPPNHGWISIADGDWLMLERVRWEIGERQLIAWRDYPTVPGSEGDLEPGSEDVYRGEAVAVFPIVDHFDIRRNFEQSTGEEGNVIGENRDKLWYDRAMFRVDWSHNLVGTYKWHITINQFTDTTAVPQYDAGDPKRYRFETDDNGKLDYFEVTTRSIVEPDIYSYFGFYGVGMRYDRSAAVIDMRHSFMRVPKSDYEPLAMPPSVVLEDQDGNEVRDENGFAKRILINDRFGYFGTLGRNTFDENRGMLTTGQIFNASRFNIWKKWRDGAGNEIPVEQREPKKITYYVNVDSAESIFPAVQRVAAEWNRAFRDTVAHAQPGRYSGALDDTGIPSDVPTMFEVKRNDCNIDNVKTHLKGLSKDARALVKSKAARKAYNDEVVSFDGSIDSVEDRFNHANSDDNRASFDAKQAEEILALNDLERLCSALEYVTAGDITLGIPPATDDEGNTVERFSYQRLGDTRYSMINNVMGNFESGWLGLGPPYCDPITGETISATANIAMAMLDRYANRAARMVGVLNGEVEPNDLTWGFDVQRAMNDKLAQVTSLRSLRPTRAAIESMHNEFDAAAAASDGEMLKDMPPGRPDARLAKVAGTAVEQNLITPDDLVMFGQADPFADSATELTDDLLNQVSPVRDGNLLNKLKAKNERIVRMGMRAMDAPEMIDPLLMGQAIQYRDLPYEERFKKLRQDIYVAVTLHEVGHNTGLFHNMAGSSDALNYGEQFWEIQKLPADMDDAVAALSSSSDPADQARVDQLNSCINLINEIGTDAPNQLDPLAANMTTQQCLRQTEVMYSSIMDYHANWNSDFGGLGPYDLAANKFAYGQLLEVFNDGALKTPTGADADRTLSRRIFLNGWETIPTDIVDGFDKIYDRDYVKMSWNTSSTRFEPPANTVPYKFGYGAQFTPDEKPFDFGPDFRSNAQNELSRYYQNFFFSHFARDRVWDYYIGDDNIAINGDINTLFDFTEKMQWFFLFEATDPEFRGSHAEEDMLAATMTGLNLFGQVIGHPAVGSFVTTQKLDVFGLLDAPPEERTTDPSDIMVQWSGLHECTTEQVANVDGNGSLVSVKPGHAATIVPLSEGRPFFLGLTDDYEDWYITYVGSYWSKVYAIWLLSYNFAFFPRVDGYSDPRAFDISWYRLFPREVSKVYHHLISEQFADLGPLAEPNADPAAPAKFIERELIAPDGTDPDLDYSTRGLKRILPSLSFNHQYFAAMLANAWASSPTDDTLDMGKTMKIAIDDGLDDLAAFDAADPADVISVTHPVSGLTMRGLKQGDFPIGYDLVKRVDRFRERFERLDNCVKDMDDNNPATNLHLTDTYCFCVDFPEYLVSGSCQQGQDIEPVGTGECTAFSLRNRRDVARESLDDMWDYVDNIRTLNRIYGN